MLRTLAAASVDAIVTDPPYELGFMGKAWDASGIAYDVTVWRECLRVLKPGGHLLAFGGSRTYHRLACAIEDAGFEVRDQIMWLYGSGFPKSLDVSKAVDLGFRKVDASDEYEWKPATGATEDVYAVTAFIKAARDKAGKRNTEIDALFGFNGMAGHWTSSASQPAVPTWPQWERLKEFLGFDDSMDDSVVSLNGGKGDRSIENSALAARDVVGHHDTAAPGQTWNANYGMRADLTPKKKLGGAATAAGKAWEGWGTALKPAHEPIVVARKPLAGTVAANVLRHGTGALNVDGCRIAHDEVCRMLPDQHGDERGSFYGQGGRHGATLELKPAGRWPANVIHDGSDEVVSLFPTDEWGIDSAARFFYAPKASAEDRDEGLRGPAVAGGITNSSGRGFNPVCSNTSQRIQVCACGSCEWTTATNPQRRNVHPTVKPTDLMRYLVRLVTPPGGTVLDPFTGSGSTGKAAALEGFHFIGCELSEEYLAIARARIEAAERAPKQQALPLAEPPPPPRSPVVRDLFAAD